MSDEPIHTPRRSAGGGGTPPPPYDGPIHPDWVEIAAAKGFDIAGRVKDRYHLLLRCHACDGLTVSKVFTLRTANPACGACQEAARQDAAARADVTFLHRDARDRHYGVYRAACGHVVRRQFEMIERAAAGAVRIRCETCQAWLEVAEAEAQGWSLLGPDPEDDDNYRLYGHGCGHEQRIARANMQTGRCACCACGTGWWSEPSFLYLMRLDLAGPGRVVKLGHSRDPASRMRFQLGLDPGGRHELIREVPMATGRAALLAEKALHARLRSEVPDLVVPPGELAGAIRVVSEIYRAEAEPLIRAHLDDLEEGETP